MIPAFGPPWSCWLPADAPWAACIGLHGINDDRTAFALAAPRLQAAGVALYAYDHRGFGDNPDRGRWPGADRLVEDLLAFIDLVGSRHPDRPLYVVAESMGAAVATVALAEASRSVAGLALLAPAVPGRRGFGRLIGAGIALLLRQRPGLRLRRFGWAAATDDPVVLRGLRSDPRYRGGTPVEIVAGIGRMMLASRTAAHRLAMPCLVLHGDRDRLIRRSAVAAFIEDWAREGLTRPRFKTYAEGWHLLLRDRQRDRVIDDLVAWMRRPSADAGEHGAIAGERGP
jgi:alpha-beta hydrolase superfamily lysophospholipase